MENSGALEEDLFGICQKYKITAASFCGTADDGTFLGYPSVDLKERRGTIESAMSCILNIGRFWQYAREQNREILSRFERG